MNKSHTDLILINVRLTISLCDTHQLYVLATGVFVPWTFQVLYTGSRDFQRSFRDERKQFVTSKAEQLELCLDLLPVTNYSVSVTAVSAKFTSTVTTNTSLTGTSAPTDPMSPAQNHLLHIVLEL